METMELCVTACEKFSNNNEVLPWVQAAPVLLAPPVGEQVPQSPQPAPESPAGSRVVPSLEAFAAGGGKMLVLSAGTDPMFAPS